MPATSDRKMVLSIDDDPQQLENFRYLIGDKYDLRVTPFADVALGFLAKNKADVILLDMEMPEINGFEFISTVRDAARLPNVKDVPIIIVSGNNDEAFMAQAKSTEAFAVLTKPVRQDTLLNVIEKALASNK